MTATDERGVESGYPHTLRPELHKALDAAGIDYWVAQGLTFWNCPDGRECVAYGFQANGMPMLAVKIVGITDPEQAIAATLGQREQPPYDELIEALRRDWDIEASWDGLRRFWYVGLTDEGVRKRDEREATLGRDRYSYGQWREISNAVGDAMEYAHDRAIEHPDAADPLWNLDEYVNRILKVAFEGEATLERGTCHNASKIMDEHGQARFACSECGAWIDSRMLWNPEYRNGESPWVSDCKLNYCPNCGRKVVDE